ncbi:hypothetical protein BGW38_006466 [Lunasporangiospora selenospora]|uniref:MAGE domain-containing protein n=1 Tax=Lunasporangiospora selenospora TaxID=979761 RepID=A0A9P6FZ10_9FUNG|nr:hypothetical protein BGW38_006466 [Lunasporangiospora selenospora]
MKLDDDDDDNDYGQRPSSSRNPNKRPPVTYGHSSGSQKRIAIDDDGDLQSNSQQHEPIVIRAKTAGADIPIPREDFERLVKNVVRLAIFTSHSDSALKRDDIRAALDNHAKLFDKVFQEAQNRLRDIFGMELVELTSKGRLGHGGEKGTKSYILVNKLPLELVQSSAVDWEPEAERTGLLMVILSLIMVRQGAIYESALLLQLRQLGLLEATSTFGDFRKELDQLIKKRYIESSKLEMVDDSGEKRETELRWGSRSRAEIPERNVVQFILEVFGAEAPLGLEASILKASGIEKKKDKEPERQQL